MQPLKETLVLLSCYITLGAYAMKNIVVQNVVVKPNLLLIKFDQTLFT